MSKKTWIASVIFVATLVATVTGAVLCVRTADICIKKAICADNVSFANDPLAFSSPNDEWDAEAKEDRATLTGSEDHFTRWFSNLRAWVEVVLFLVLCVTTITQGYLFLAMVYSIYQEISEALQRRVARSRRLQRQHSRR